MKKKYILVTGGLGYIGSNTIAILKKNKWKKLEETLKEDILFDLLLLIYMLWTF